MEDEVPPLPKLDSDSVASSTGAYRANLQFRRPSTGLKRTDSEPTLRRTRSRQFSRTSTDSILLPRMTEDPLNDPDEPIQQWHSISLLFVALPAFAGIFFENGSAVMTDILLLGLGCLFLYWSIKWPWQWYHSTQELKLADINPDTEFAIVEETSEDERDEQANAKPADDTPRPADDKSKAPGSYPTRNKIKRAEAAQSLQSLELMALLSCFLSPIVVAYMLHNIRPYLSRPSGGVVSNSNLTLFVLAAEVRPVLHFFRLVEARTLHLQRVVTTLSGFDDSSSRQEKTDLLSRRIEELEERITSPSSGMEKDKREASVPAIERNVRQSLQPQLDALNRAVRRYEKRATTQAIVIEARLQDLESRLKDALSLAAAASRNQQKPGIVVYTFDVLWSISMVPIEAFWALMVWPVRLAGEFYRFLFGPRRKKKRPRSPSDFKGKTRLEQR